MKTVIIAIALALAVPMINTLAQDTVSPPPAPPPISAPDGGPEKGPGKFHLLPPRAQEQLKLTADQQKQVADLETEVKAKLEKILTPEQQQQLKQMRPPHQRPQIGGTGSDDSRPAPPGQ